jgi:hypothetical protein
VYVRLKLSFVPGGLSRSNWRARQQLADGLKELLVIDWLVEKRSRTQVL